MKDRDGLPFHHSGKLDLTLEKLRGNRRNKVAVQTKKTITICNGLIEGMLNWKVADDKMCAGHSLWDHIDPFYQPHDLGK